jgi:hypothetical protein
MTTAAPLTQTAEQYALGCLRRHRDAMTYPNMQAIADDSALTVREVEKLWEQLLAGRAPKPLDQPRVVHAPPSPPAATTTPTRPVEAPTWQSAKDHPSPGIRAKHKRAVAAIADLEEALAAEDAKDKLRAKEARLLAELAKVRAELATQHPHRCALCGRGFSRSQALGAHMKKSHS